MEKKKNKNKNKRATTTSASLLLEQQNYQKKGFLGGALANAAMSGMASTIQAKGGCCPICPNLQTILNSNVPIDESFGGPFAPAMESKESGGKIIIFYFIFYIFYIFFTLYFLIDLD